MKPFILTLALAFLAIMPHTAKAMDMEHSAEKADVTAITFRSDSCGACKILEPKIEKALDSLSNETKEKINMVKFDFSNKQAIENTKELAQSEGVNNILQEYGAKTGFVVLLNNHGEEVDMLKVDDSVEDIASKLTKVIASAS